MDRLDYRLFLCLSTKEEICEISYKNLKFKHSFRDYNTLSFDVPYYDDGWEMYKDHRFDLVKGLFYVRMRIFDNTTELYEEYFVIDQPQSAFDGMAAKRITAHSKEYMLFNKRRIREYKETTALYDSANPTDPSAGLMNYILNTILYGSWSIGYINPELQDVVRTWDFRTRSLTEVHKDLEKQLNCVIKTNHLTNEVSFYKLEELGSDLDLVVSNKNYIDNLTADDKVSDLITRVSVYGANNLTMAGYNITGENFVDNFDWIQNAGLLSVETSTALTAYKDVVALAQSSFDALTANLEANYDALVVAQSQLAGLNTDLNIIQEDLSRYKSLHKRPTQDYLDRFAQKAPKEAAIAAKQVEIQSISDDIASDKAGQLAISGTLMFKDHFTASQLEELNNFIFEDEINLDSIEDSKLLYQYGKEYLQTKSTPVLELTLSLLDVLKDSKWKADWNKIINACGSFLYVDVADMGLDHVQMRVVEIQHTPASDDLTFVVSNADKVKKDLDFLAGDYWQESKLAARTAEVTKYDHNKYVTESHKIQMTDKPIDLEEQEIVAGNTRINKRGFQGDDVGGNGSLELVDDKLVVSRDGWQTYRTLLSGEGLHLEREDGMARIIIHPDYGFQMDKNVGTVEAPNWHNVLYFDGEKQEYIFDGTLSTTTLQAIAAEIDVVVSQTVIVQNLTAEKGYIAELTVDSLDTSDKVRKYLEGDSTSEIHYIRIVDQVIEFIKAIPIGDGSWELAKDRKDRQLYWTDETHNGITITDTDPPSLETVKQYVYTEEIKMKWHHNLDGSNEPTITMGQGFGIEGYPERGIANIVKGADGLALKYVTANGANVSIGLTEAGIVGIDEYNGPPPISDIDLYSDGMVITDTLTNVYDFTFTRDGSGRITAITNNTLNKTTNVTYNATTKP